MKFVPTIVESVTNEVSYVAVIVVNVQVKQCVTMKESGTFL